MTVQALDNLIESTPDVLGGKPRIAGRRISVQNVVVWHEWMGLSADEIASEYDISLAEIYAALAYHFSDPEQTNQTIKNSQALVLEMQKKVSSKLPFKFSE